MAFIPSSGSVVAFQSDPTKLQASVVGRVDIGNLSQASGSVVAFLGNSTNASVIVVGGTQGNSSVMLTPGINTIGSVATLQGTSPWIVQPTSGSVIAFQLAGSVMAVNATVNTGNSSVQVLAGTATIGSVATLQGTNPWIVQLTSGSVITSGGNSSVQVVGTIPPMSVAGVGTFNINPVGNGSVIATLINSSVTTLQGTNPWVIGNSSVMLMPGTNTIGSVAVLQGTNPWQVIIPGSVLSLNEVIRNDTVSSFLGVDLTSRYMASDSAGRVLFKPFAANEASIFGVSSTVNSGDAASVVAVPAAGAGLRNYLTDIMVTNSGSVATVVTFTEGGGSILGRTIAPGGGGSNIIGMASPIRNQTANQPINFVSGTSSSTLSVVVTGFRAP